MQLAFDLTNSTLPPLTEQELLNIRKAISLRWKGMASRATYQDMHQAIGLALRACPMSVADKRDFAIQVASKIHGLHRETSRDMSVDHICRIANVPFERIEEVLPLGKQYPYRVV